MIQFNLSDYISFKLVASIITISSHLNQTTPPPEPIRLPTPSPTQPSPISRSNINVLRQRSDLEVRIPDSKINIPNISIPSRARINLEDHRRTPTPTSTSTPRISHPTPTLKPTKSPTPTPQPPTPTPEPIQPESTGNSITDIVNDYRQDHNLSGLHADDDICDVAEARARQASREFSHDGFEAGVSRLAYSKAAENLWQGEPFSLERMINSWNDSPGHQRNLVGDYNFGCGARHHHTVAFIFIKR